VRSGGPDFSFHPEDILRCLHEAEGDIIHTLAYTEAEILKILLRRRLRGENQVREIDSFAGGKSAAVYHPAKQAVLLHALHHQFQQAVVKENAGFRGNILKKPGVGDRNVLPRGLVFGCASGSQPDMFSFYKQDTTGWEISNPDLGAAEVLKQPDVLARFSAESANILDHPGVAVVGAVGKIQPCHIHAGIYEGTEHRRGGGSGSDGGDDFCLFRHLFYRLGVHMENCSKIVDLIINSIYNK
jgi:hypothetical protein